jgi:hypothetical protein
MLRWAQCGFHKKHARTCYAELVILHPVRSAGHVVHFGAFGLRNVDALFFMLGWASCVLHKKRDGTSYAELVCLHLLYLWFVYCISVHLGCGVSPHYFSCSGGPATVSIKSALEHVTPNFCFCIRWDLRVT